MWWKCAVERIVKKEFQGSTESGQTERNAILKTEEPEVALPVESLHFPHGHRHGRISREKFVLNLVSSLNCICTIFRSSSNSISLWLYHQTCCRLSC
jgi:hypothetical protein